MTAKILSLPLPSNVLRVLKEGRMVEAIRLLHTIHGLGLKEAKDLLDSYATGLAHPIASADQPMFSPSNLESTVVPASTLLQDALQEEIVGLPTSIAGEIWLNNRNLGADIQARFGHYHVDVWDQRNIHALRMEFCVTPDELESAIGSMEGREAVSAITSWRLGEIQDYNCLGLQARDVGCYSRKIEKLTFKCTRLQRRLRFDFEGTTGSLSPGTAWNKTKAEIDALGKYDFHVWLEISDSDLASYIHDERSLAIISGYAARVPSSTLSGREHR